MIPAHRTAVSTGFSARVLLQDCNWPGPILDACCVGRKWCDRKLLMRFCPYCGAPVVPAGKFCVECGRQLDRPSAGGIKGLHLTAAFVGVFLAMLLVGMLVVYLIVPGTQRQVSVASAPSGSAPAAQGQQGDQTLPPGHPALQLPAEARSFVDQVEKEAHAKPNDIAAWDKLGEVALRAAMIDPSYYPKAEDAYGHALKLNPDNPD